MSLCLLPNLCVLWWGDAANAVESNAVSSRSGRDGSFPGAFQGSQTISPGMGCLPAGQGSLAHPGPLCQGITGTANLCLGPRVPGEEARDGAAPSPFRHPTLITLFLPKSFLGHLERLLLRSVEVTASRKVPGGPCSLRNPIPVTAKLVALKTRCSLHSSYAPPGPSALATGFIFLSASKSFVHGSLGKQL